MYFLNIITMIALSSYINLYMHRAPSWHWKYSHFMDRFFNVSASSMSTPFRPNTYYSRVTNVRGFSWEVPHLSLRPCITMDTCISFILVPVSDPPLDYKSYYVPLLYFFLFSSDIFQLTIQRFSQLSPHTMLHMGSSHLDLNSVSPTQAHLNRLTPQGPVLFW